MPGDPSPNKLHEEPASRILIIDDHPSTLSMLGDVIKEAGYEPLLAPGGNDGLRLLRERKVDLIVLDLMLEDMDGWTVLKTIKMDDSVAHIPVLIVTARTWEQEQQRIDSHTGLFEAFVLKPFNVDQLLGKIAAIVAR
jgi:DNA-binding response OmpR family regulator